MNEIYAYYGEDFNFIASITDKKVPLDHQNSIRRELEKLYRFPYNHLLPPKKILKGIGSICNGMPLYELRPRCSNQTQYRLPLVSPMTPKFLILGFFPRKDADFPKQKRIAETRYEKITHNQATYVHVNLEQLTLL